MTAQSVRPSNGLPFTLAIAAQPLQFLLTVEGDMVAPSLEQGRQIHNMTAGSPEGVAGARSFGDLSHAVFVPVEPPASGAGKLLIVDYWNSVDGLRQFFSNPQVGEGAKLLYASRDPVVWATTPSMPRFNLPAPTGRNDRYLGMIRGPVVSRAAAEASLAKALVALANTARAKGLMMRDWYFRADTPDSLEVIGIDLWFDAEGMMEVYNDPAEMAPFADLFTAAPVSSVWRKPEGQWVEW